MCCNRTSTLLLLAFVQKSGIGGHVVLTARVHVALVEATKRVIVLAERDLLFVPVVLIVHVQQVVLVVPGVPGVPVVPVALVTYVAPIIHVVPALHTHCTYITHCAVRCDVASQV